MSSIRERAKELLIWAESPAEKALLWAVQLPAPWTFVSLVAWTLVAFVAGAIML
jgi:hypothetical protein